MKMCLNNTYKNVPICQISFLFRTVLTRRCFIASAFHICLRICRLGWIKIEWVYQIMGYVGDDNLLQNRETLLIAGKELNKLLMFSHQKHNGLNHKERYKKSPFKM